MDINDCCEIAGDALDGKYGWQDEVLTILVVVIVFNFVAKWVLKNLHKYFEKQKKVWQDSFVQALFTPLTVYTWLFALISSFNLIAPQSTAEYYLDTIHQSLAVGGILCLSWFILRWKSKIIQLSIYKSRTHEISWNPSKIDIIGKVGTVAILFITILLVLEVTNRSITTLIAFGGIGGLAIAFASQEIIANFFSGLMLYVTHPFSVGDWINLPERRIEGHVEEIGWYMTRIRTFEKRPVYIPNSIFSKILIETPSRMSHRQFKEIFSLKYQDMKFVKDIISDVIAMLEKHDEIDHELPSLAHLKAFGQTGLDIQISAYILKIDSESYAITKQDILFKVIKILEKYNVELSSPTTIEIPNGIVIKNSA